MISNLSVTVSLILALYGSTTIQSRLFFKNIKNFVWFPKQYLLCVFILEKQLTNIPDRGFLFLRNTLLLYSLSPYSRTKRQTESQIHSLALAGGTFFPVVLLFQFFVLAGRVPYSCGVVLVFLVLVGNSFWCYVRTYCTIQLYGCVFFLSWRES